MSKKKSIALLSVISAVLAIIIAMTFASFHIGVKEYGLFKAFTVGGDLAQGYSYTIEHSEDDDEVVDTNEVVKTLQTRLEALDYSAYKITLLKTDDDSDYKIRLDVEERESTPSDITSVISYGEVIFYGGAEGEEEEIATGAEVIKDAYYASDYANEETGVHPVIVEFNSEGYDLILNAIEEFTESQASAEEPKSFNLKAVLGEDNTLLNTTMDAETFKSYNGTLQLSGPSSAADAERFAFQIATGGLKYKYEIIDGDEDTAGIRHITHLFGINAGKYVALAIGVAVLVVIALLCIFYRGLGIAMSIAYILGALVEVWLLFLIPGISVNFGACLGIALMLIVSAISCFIFADRIKKEYASGKTIRASVKYAYGKPALTVLDAHVVVGVLALALFIFANGAVKSLAITFGIGIIVSALISIVISKWMVSLMIGVSEGNEKFLAIYKEEA